MGADADAARLFAAYASTTYQVATEHGLQRRQQADRRI